MRLMVAVLSLLLVSHLAAGKIAFLPLDELVGQSQLICLARLVKSEPVDPKDPSRIKNVLAVEKVLKGAWNASESLCIVTSEDKREDRVVIFEDVELLLFLEPSEDGSQRPVHGLQGVWALEDHKPVRMGSRYSLEEVEAEIRNQLASPTAR